MIVRLLIPVPETKYLEVGPVILSSIPTAALTAKDKIATDAIGINNANGLTVKRDGCSLLFIVGSLKHKKLIVPNYQP
ncbi:MAG: hypothetical protein ACI90U_000096 [Pseudomonadales bacterium]